MDPNTSSKEGRERSKEPAARSASGENRGIERAKALRSKSDDALSTSDTAVRRALAEIHQEALRFLQKRLGSRQVAEEVLQRFNLKALESAAGLRNAQTVRGWLNRVLATTIVDHHRAVAARRRREVPLEPGHDEIAGTEALSELDQTVCICLYKVLPLMKPEYAEVIWRVDLLGEPQDRVAVSLGTNLNNISVRLHRGRRALKKRLQEACLTCPIHGFLDCRCDYARKMRRARAKFGPKPGPS